MYTQVAIAKEETTLTDSPDVCRVFIRKLSSLYRLAFLLTTTHSHAEQCTLATFEEVLDTTGIPSSSAESWSKRSLIKNALRIVRRQSLASENTVDGLEAWKEYLAACPFNAIIRLDALERFVFVLSILEKIPDSECSRLLGCAVSEIAPARIRAIELLSTFERIEKEESTGRSLSPALAYSSV